MDTNLKRILMDIHLSDSDISQMPEPGRTWFLNWLPEFLKTKRSEFDQVPVRQQPNEPQVPPAQLVLNLESQTLEEKADHSHVRLTQLFDAGITEKGMAVRVKLKEDVAKKLGRKYVNGLEISGKGTIIFDGQEFDKPSPLATKVNGSSVNGWKCISLFCHSPKTFVISKC